MLMHNFTDELPIEMLKSISAEHRWRCDACGGCERAEMRESANLAHCQFATPQRSESNLGKFGPSAASPRSPPSKSRREKERGVRGKFYLLKVNLDEELQGKEFCSNSI